jgi:hypothetical protein
MSFLKNYGCASLFIAPFLLIGIGSFLYPVYEGIRGLTMNDWVKVEATLLDVKMITTTHHDGGSSDEVVPTYEYMYRGRLYKSNKVAPGYGSNNTEAHTDLYHLLRKSKKIIVLINPDEPSQAVIAKDINMSVIGLFLFSILWNSLLGVFITPRFFKAAEEENKQFII